jgi:hypothetical protein
MTKLLFTLPWGKVVSHEVRAYDNNGAAGTTTVPRFTGNPDIYAGMLMKAHGVAGACGIVDTIVNSTSTPEIFWKRVQEVIATRVKRDALAKIGKPA